MEDKVNFYLPEGVKKQLQEKLGKKTMSAFFREKAVEFIYQTEKKNPFDKIKKFMKGGRK